MSEVPLYSRVYQYRVLWGCVLWARYPCMLPSFTAFARPLPLLLATLAQRIQSTVGSWGRWFLVGEATLSPTCIHPDPPSAYAPYPENKVELMARGGPVQEQVLTVTYRGTSLTRKNTLLGPHRSALKPSA